MKESWEKLDQRKIPEWFQRAKFGIFIHWGPYSVPAYRSVNNEQFGSYAEWYYASVYGTYRNQDQEFHKRMYGDSDYREFGKQFHAELFDPEYLADLIQKSGAKYMVLTTKHHDGYCMWPTKNPYKKGWNSGEIGPKKDLVGKLRTAVIQKGIEFGVYYSIIDWESVPSHRCNGGYFIPQKDVEKYGVTKETYLKEILKPQLYELVETYEPSLIFSDGGEWDLTEEESSVRSFLSWLYQESPLKDKVVVNDRFYKEMPGNHGDYYSTEYRDKVIGGHPWEESRGIGKSYGFNRAERLEDYSTSKELISELVSIVSKGGNFLLNIGPMADGTIPIHEVERLMEIGAWLEICGEAIYDTTPYEEESKIPVTAKDEALYLFLQSTDFKKIPFLLGQERKIQKIEVLGAQKDCHFSYDQEQLEISVDNLEKVIRLSERFGMNVVKIIT